MGVQISYRKSVSKQKVNNVVLFVDEKFNISGLKKHISSSENLFISDLIKVKNLKKKIIVFDVSSKKKIILVSLKNNLISSDSVNLGAKFYDLFKNLNQSQYTVYSDTLSDKSKHILGFFLHGIKLKSYKFEKYKTIY